MSRGYENRLHNSFKHAPVVPFYSNSKIILFSDCHRGTGTSNDNLLKNQHLYYAALKYYYDHDFIYIELGDGDELWKTEVILPFAKCMLMYSICSPASKNATGFT